MRKVYVKQEVCIGCHLCYKVLVSCKADAALAASILHYGTHSISNIKEYLAKQGIPIRI